MNNHHHHHHPPPFQSNNIRLPSPPRPPQSRPTTLTSSPNLRFGTDIDKTGELVSSGGGNGSSEANYRIRPTTSTCSSTSSMSYQAAIDRMRSSSTSRSPVKPKPGQTDRASGGMGMSSFIGFERDEQHVVRTTHSPQQPHQQQHQQQQRPLPHFPSHSPSLHPSSGQGSLPYRDRQTGRPSSPGPSRTNVPRRPSHVHALSDLLDPSPSPPPRSERMPGDVVRNDADGDGDGNVDLDVDIDGEGGSGIGGSAVGTSGTPRPDHPVDGVRDGREVAVTDDPSARATEVDHEEDDDDEDEDGDEDDEDEDEDDEDEADVDADADEEEQVDGEIVGQDDDEEEDEDEDDDEEEDEEEDDDDDDKSVDLSDDEPVFISSRKPLTMDQLLSAPSSQTNDDDRAIKGQGSIRVKQESQDLGPAGLSQIDGNKNDGDGPDGDVQMVLVDLPRSADQTTNDTGLILPRSASTEAMQVDEQTVATQGSVGGASLPESTLTSLPDSSRGTQAGAAATTTTTHTATAATLTGTNVTTGPTTTTIVKGKKKRAVLTTTSAVPEAAPPQPRVIDMKTVRLEFDLLNPTASTNGKTPNKEKHGHKPLIINFKQEAIDRGVVEKGYWEGLWGLGLEGEKDDNASDGDANDDDEDNDVDMDGKAAGKKQGKSKLSIGQVPGPKAGPGPTSSLAALMAAVDDDPSNSVEAARLAAEFDKRYEEQSGSKTTTTVATKKRTRKPKEDGYDVGDPFVDDSELMVDEPMFYQEPKRSGFYVAMGDVELCGVVEDEPTKRRRKKRANGDQPSEGDQASAPMKKRKTKTILGMGIRPGMLSAEVRKSSLNNLVEGTLVSSGAPIAESRQESPEVQILETQRKDEPPMPYQIIYYGSPEEALAAVPEAIHAELLEVLRTSQTCDQSNKKSFPETLVTPCKALGHKAIDLRIMDNPFFDVIPKFIFYNRFTMRRWLLTNCRDYVPISIANLEDKILQQMQTEIDILAIDYTQERDALIEEIKRTSGETVQELDPITGEVVEVPVSLPPKKWRWTARLREMFAASVENVEYEIDYVEKYSEAMAGKAKAPIVKPKGQAIRTRLYGRVVELFPEGWMTTGLLSREMSAMKTKKKQVQA